MFYKYFGDPKSIYSINVIGYIKLMLAAKRILEISGMVVLPYIISGKVLKMPNKKSINKKYINMITTDPLWANIEKMYEGDDGILNDILEKIGVIMSGEYVIISPTEPDLDGRLIDYNCALLIAKEYMELILMMNNKATIGD